jgi:hypothetical protein
MPPKRIADDSAPKARKPRAPKERPPGMTNAALAADVERRQTEMHGRAKREKKLAASPGFFTQEEARATEAVAAAARVGIDDQGFGDSGQDVDEEEEEQADLHEDNDAPEDFDLDVEGEEEKEEELAADRASDQMDGQRRGVPRRSLEDRFHERHYRRELKL